MKTMSSTAVMVMAAMLLGWGMVAPAEGSSRALLNLGKLIDHLIDCPPPPAPEEPYIPAAPGPYSAPYSDPSPGTLSPAPGAYEPSPEYQSPPAYDSPSPVYEPSPEYQSPPAYDSPSPVVDASPSPVYEPSPEYQSPPAGGY